MSSLRKGGGHTLLGNALFERGNQPSQKEEKKKDT